MHQTKVKSGLSCQTVYGTNEQTFCYSVQQGDDCDTQQSDDLSVQQNEECDTQRNDEHSVWPDHYNAAKIGDDCAAQRSDFQRVQSNDGTTGTADQQTDVRSIHQSKGDAVFSQNKSKRTRQSQAYPNHVKKSRGHVFRPRALLKPPNFLTYK